MGKEALLAGMIFPQNSVAKMTFLLNNGKASIPVFRSAWVLGCLESQTSSRTLNTPYRLWPPWEVGHLVFLQFLLQLKSQGLLILNFTVLLTDVELFPGAEGTCN